MFIRCNVLSTLSTFQEEQNSSWGAKSHFTWLTDLCAQTQAVLKPVLSFSSNFVCSLTLAYKQRALKNVTQQHKSVASERHCCSAENSVHGCAFVCPAGENIRHPVTQYCPCNKAQPWSLGLSSFLGFLGLALFWDRVFLMKVRSDPIIKIGQRAILKSVMGTLCEATCTCKTWGRQGSKKNLIQHLASHLFLTQIQHLLYVVVANVANINYFIRSFEMLGSGSPNTSSWSNEII